MRESPMGIASVRGVFADDRAIRTDHGPHGVVWFYGDRGEDGALECVHLKEGVFGVSPVDVDTVERSVDKAEAVHTEPVGESPLKGAL